MTPTISFEERLLDELVRAHKEMQRKAPHHRRSVALVGVAAAVAAVLVGQGVGLFGSSAPASAAVQTLKKLAKVAQSDAVTSTFMPGTYAFVQSQGINEWADNTEPGHGFVAEVPYSEERWLGYDGSGRIVDTYASTGYNFPTQQDYENWVASGKPSPANSDDSYSAGQLALTQDGIDELTLPADPKAIMQVVQSHIAAGIGTARLPYAEFQIIGDLLFNSVEKPTVRVGLFTVAESIPGLVYNGTVSTPSGTKGEGISLVNPISGHSIELIFDPTSASLVGKETWATGASGEKTLINWSSYSTSMITASDAQAN